MRNDTFGFLFSKSIQTLLLLKFETLQLLTIILSGCEITKIFRNLRGDFLFFYISRSIIYLIIKNQSNKLCLYDIKYVLFPICFIYIIFFIHPLE